METVWEVAGLKVKAKIIEWACDGDLWWQVARQDLTVAMALEVLK